MRNLRKFIPYLLIILFSITIVSCDLYGTRNIDKDVVNSILVNEKGIGEKTATKVVECLTESDLLRMNLNNPITNSIKLISLLCIIFISVYMIRRDIRIVNMQSFDGHKNTQELLLEVSTKEEFHESEIDKE